MPCNHRSMAVLVLLCLISAPTTRADRGQAGSSDPLADVMRSVSAATIGAPAFRFLSVVMEGRVRRPLIAAGGNAPSHEERALRIVVRLPDHYLRQETVKGKSGGVVFSSGFAGDRLLNSVRTFGTGMNYGGSWGPEQLPVERAEFLRLLLGCMPASPPSVLTLAYGGRVEYQGARVNAIDAAAEGDFRATLLVDEATFLPAALRYRTPVRLPVPRVPEDADPTTGGARIPSPPPAVETLVELRYLDFRIADGVRIPHKIVKVAQGVILEEVEFTSVKVNDDVPDSAFAPPGVAR